MNNIEFLKQNGFNIDQALSYLGDIETFNEILKDFYDGLDDQVNELLSKKDDMPNYAILVHALKSNCRSLGIIRYADICYEEELKSKEGDSEFILEHCSKIVEEKEKVKNIIKTYLGL
ncbi:MAG: Hpt domain-containing protein [bacterium]|nr:Hpt domain-containing protein [bacterium]